MENKIVNANPGGAETVTTEQGRWVAVDASKLGFQLNGTPDQPIQGPDGNIYKIGESQPQLTGVASNFNNAIPMPSSIVQMPPIVQPIALVPYTSQNQPLLQYDPYSRPVEPQVTAPKPRYVKKPYRGISLAAFILSIAAAVLFAFLAVSAFKANDTRPAFSSNAIDNALALLAAAGLKVESNYFKYRIEHLSGGDVLSTIVIYAVPVFAVIIFIIFLLLAIKYVYKLGSAKTPRAFSFGAFINMVLCLSIAGMLLGMSNAEVKVAERSQNIAKFFTFESSIAVGIGLLIAFALSVVLFILPFFAKKNAYMLDKGDPSKRAYIIED